MQKMADSLSFLNLNRAYYLNNDRWSTILHLIEVNFFRLHPSLKAIWHGFPDITHIKAHIADSSPSRPY